MSSGYRYCADCGVEVTPCRSRCRECFKALDEDIAAMYRRGFRPREIAEEFDLKVQTVKYRAWKARQRGIDLPRYRGAF